ncbi:MAG: hypothetical protein M3Q17_11750 [Actinomycetota bacterium]|nr:hypothetical protein [Actinomycetota bacterium]
MSADVLDRTPQGAPPQTAPDKPTGFTDEAWAATWPELLLALMIVILVIGMVVDSIFSALAQRVRTRRGLTGFR